MLKKILSSHIIIVAIATLLPFIIIIGIITTIIGFSFGYEKVYRELSEARGSETVINNQIYASRYRNLLNKYLSSKGYVSLERLVFYLQRTNNVLDITTLSDDLWEDAYLKNLNSQRQQMIPIKTICKELKEDKNLPHYKVETGFNKNGLLIEKLDLCNVDDIDITTSNEYNEEYNYLPYIFPLKDNFTVTSMVFENRNIDFGLSDKEQENVNHHSGWDFSVPIGTNFYSVCDGTIKDIIYTQYNDLPFSSSGNQIGNYVEVECDNGLIASYKHIKASSVPLTLKKNSKVKMGNFLGLTSTTGRSTGPHLHLELYNSEGKRLDAMEYIDFIKSRGSYF